MKTLLVMATALLSTACATISEQEKEAREYRQTDWENRYIAYANRCDRAGGQMIVNKASLVGDRDIPRRHELFRCSTYIGRQPRH